jgi:hypothetical protein
MDDPKAGVEVRGKEVRNGEKLGLKDVTRLLDEKQCRGSFAEGPRHPGLSCPPPQ